MPVLQKSTQKSEAPRAILKVGGLKKGVTKIFIPFPLGRRKTPLLENTCFFPLIFYKQSDSEKISITKKIDFTR